MEKTEKNKVKSLFDLSKEFTDTIAIGGAVLHINLNLPEGLLELLYKKSKEMYECASQMYFDSLDDHGTETDR